MAGKSTSDGPFAMCHCSSEHGGRGGPSAPPRMAAGSTGSCRGTLPLQDGVLHEGSFRGACVTVSLSSSSISEATGRKAIALGGCTCPTNRNWAAPAGPTEHQCSVLSCRHPLQKAVHSLREQKATCGMVFTEK